MPASTSRFFGRSLGWVRSISVRLRISSTVKPVISQWRRLAKRKRPSRSTIEMPAVSWSTMARNRMSLSRMAASARWRSCEARLSASPTSLTSRRLVATGELGSPPPMVRAALASWAIERAIHSPAAAAPITASRTNTTRLSRTCRSHSCIGPASTAGETSTAVVQPLSRCANATKLPASAWVRSVIVPSRAPAMRWRSSGLARRPTLSSGFWLRAITRPSRSSRMAMRSDGTSMRSTSLRYSTGSAPLSTRSSCPTG